MDWLSYLTGLLAGVLLLCIGNPDNWPAGLSVIAGGLIACLIMKVAERVMP